MSLREAAQQAIDALCELKESAQYNSVYAKTIDALRVALAEDSMQRLSDFQQMIERGTQAWAEVPNATAYVEDLRGNEPVTDRHEKAVDNLSPPSDHIGDANKMVATIKDNLTVEPVAYVTGYSKGRCIIKAVDPDWLLPVGMALYRSPPTINKMETVEHGIVVKE